MIRPSGPVPLTWPSGTPFSSAIFLARGLAKNLGLSLSLALGGAFWPAVPSLPDPYLASSAGVPSAGVPPDLLASFWSEVEGVSDLFSPEDFSTGLSDCDLDSDEAEEEEEEEPSAAKASAPEKSSPSSPMMAIGVPTAMALAPSCD